MKRLITLILVLATASLAGAARSATTADAPVNTGAPVISGSPYVGKTLTSTTGTWNGSPTGYAYQWARCDSKGNGCVQISGATTHDYVLASADVNYTLETWVTATNATGTTGPVNSKPTTVITPALPPTSTALPGIIGKPLVGQVLLADPGKYSGGAVTAYAYRWQHCDPNGVTCGNLAATTQTYTIGKNDVGRRLRVVVAASNPYGHTTNTSAATVAVTVPVTTVSTTMAASATSTICCQVVLLSGTTSPAQAGEQITILAHAYGDLASLSVGTAVTDATGYWTAKVTPQIQTSYTAQTATSKGPTMSVAVHPRVGFGVNGNTFSAKITGRGSFGGKIAYFQMQTTDGNWRRLALVVINQYSVAKFSLKTLLRGHTYRLRIYLPQSQAGAGYMSGTSHTQRVGGSS